VFSGEGGGSEEKWNSRLFFFFFFQVVEVFQETDENVDLRHIL
jgi:hypothetical protein